MTKKNIYLFSGLFVLSVVVTFIASIVNSLIKGSFFAGSSGFPLQFEDASFFGEGYINYTNFSLDVIFWFVVLLLVAILLQKFRK